MKKISVIIPTYRPDTYIFKCLESLLNQTLPKNQFEIIVVLNGDKEPYEKQLSEFAERFGEQTIQILYSEEKGVSNARNTGIEASKGKYLVFVDDDDWVSPNYLTNLLSQADPNTIVLSNVVAIDEDRKTPTQHFMSDAYAKNKGNKNVSLFKIRSYFSSPCGKIIPRNVIGDNRFLRNFSLGEDALFMFDISRKVKRIQMASPDTIYYIWIRKNSASRSHYSYFFRLKLAMRTAWRYTTIFLRNPFGYHFPFYLSRIVATFRKLFQKTYK
ncbi:MAG: glycosyltransferase family 2 protein [Prevotella sp.]|nr:glycosyltransferase family 2 protein [Prevotella sp.]